MATPVLNVEDTTWKARGVYIENRGGMKIKLTDGSIAKLTRELVRFQDEKGNTELGFRETIRMTDDYRDYLRRHHIPTSSEH